MTGDVPAAALRLMAELPVRTHLRTMTAAHNIRFKNNTRGVIIGRTVYESVTDAGRQLGKSRGAIRNMIERGEARYES